MMQIETKIEQFKQLKRSKKLIEGRLENLRHEIINVPANTLSKSGLKLQRRDRTGLDEFKTWEIMDRYGIPHHKFTKKVLDPDLIEELYWNGTLSDSDLREIRRVDYNIAIVEVEDEDVQEQPDNLH